MLSLNSIPKFSHEDGLKLVTSHGSMAMFQVIVILVVLHIDLYIVFEYYDCIQCLVRRCVHASVQQPLLSNNTHTVTTHRTLRCVLCTVVTLLCAVCEKQQDLDLSAAERAPRAER